MLRLQGLGSNTPSGVPYTEDEIMAIVRGGKQRWHILGVGRILPGQGMIIPPSPPCTHPFDVAKLKRREKLLTKKMNMLMKLFRSDDKFSQMLTQLESQPEYGSGSGSDGCDDDELGDVEDGDEDGEDKDDKLVILVNIDLYLADNANFVTSPGVVVRVSRPGTYPLRAFPFDLSRATCRPENLSPATSRPEICRPENLSPAISPSDSSDLSLGKMVTVVVELYQSILDKVANLNPSCLRYRKDSCCFLKFYNSSSMADFLFFFLFLCSNKDVSESLTQQNIGPNSANHCGSTVVTHCMYSLVLNISSWYTTYSGMSANPCKLSSGANGTAPRS
nr:hypothetical protein [Tanacetum cinerariifolium]